MKENEKKSKPVTTIKSIKHKGRLPEKKRDKKSIQDIQRAMNKMKY